jgi:hypothetical protein
MPVTFTKDTKPQSSRSNLNSIFSVPLFQWLILVKLRASLRPTRRKAFTAQNWSSGLRLEGHAVGLAALIADNLEAFAFAASATALSLAAKILAARIPTGLAAFGMGQSAFAIVILLSFSKRKGRSALGTSDIEIWHGLLPWVI